MRRPKTTMENWDKVIEYYSNEEINKTYMKFFHWASSKLVSTCVTYEGGELTRQTIGEHMGVIDPRKKPGQILAMINHQHYFDHAAAAGFIHNEEMLKPVIGNIAVPASAIYLDKIPERWIVRPAGVGVPVMRAKDIDGNASLTDEELETRRRDANRLSMEIVKQRMNKGVNGALYPEGTRNKGDVSQILPIREGVIDLAQGLIDPENVMPMFVGVSYKVGHNSEVNHRQANIHVSILPPDYTASLTVDQVAVGLQDCVDAAISR